MGTPESAAWSQPPDWPALAHRLRRLALALTRRSDDADDLAQATFAALLAKAPDRIAHVGYARQTMLRLWLDQQRSLRRRLARLGRLAAARPVAWIAGDSAADAEQAARVEQAVASLPPLQRASLVLRVVEELGYAEIAQMLGTTIESVRTSLHLARQRVRDIAGDAT